MVLLSFDIEEFDLLLELGRQDIDAERQINISSKGLFNILDVLDRQEISATFYSTLYFMEHITPELRGRLLAQDHEIASHGVLHSEWHQEDYLKSRLGLQALTGQAIKGFRMARMQAVDYQALRDAGYSYDSSLHPTWLPGRYNHLSEPRLPQRHNNGLWLLPASVTPVLRLPLFWLAVHNYPQQIYKWLALWTARNDSYLNIYLHPWEFADLRDLPYRIPSYILRNSGEALSKRLEDLIVYLSKQGQDFATTSTYLQTL